MVLNTKQVNTLFIILLYDNKANRKALDLVKKNENFT